MTTNAGDDIKDRILSFGEGQTLGEGVSTTGFFDPTGNSPRQSYIGSSSVNSIAKGHDIARLTFGGSVSGVDLGINETFPSEAGRVRMLETPGGHQLELNDTPGGERITLKHKTGAGVEIQPNGTIILSSLDNQVTLVGGSQAIIVEGDGNLIYKGNLTLNVTGDFTVNCGNFNVNTQNKKEVINGNNSTKIQGGSSTVIAGNASNTVAGHITNLALGGMSHISKGDYSIVSEGSTNVSSKGQMSVSSETKYTNSSPNTNITATNLSVFGSSGTIGGENIIMYNYNMHTTKTVWTETINTNLVYGDLKGTAEFAIRADVTNSQEYAETATGSTSGYIIDDTVTDTTATALPTGALMTQYLNNSTNGIKKISIDLDGYLLDSIRNPVLTPSETRARMRDPNYASNAEFTSKHIANGVLSNSYTQPAANRIGRTAGPSPTPSRGRTPIGNNTAITDLAAGYLQPQTRTITAPPANINPNNIVDIGPRTVLANGIMLAKFTSGAASGVPLPDSLGTPDRRQIARNYWLMSLYLKTVSNNNSQFKNYRLEVAEGYYDKSNDDKVTIGGMLDLRSQGRAIAFRLVDIHGNIALSKTYDLALHWKNTMPFEKLILDYDNMNTGNVLDAHIIVQIPNISPTYSATYSQKVESRFNDNVIGAGLIECLPDGNSGRSAYVVTPDNAAAIDAEIPAGGYPADGTNGKLNKSSLVSIGIEVDGEEGYLSPSAAASWKSMVNAAAADGIELKIQDSYRSYEEQVVLWNNYKRGTGNKAAYPGRSKHGWGNAIDVAYSGYNTAVFKWLQRNAGNYGFYNEIAGEPWHWEYK